MKNSNDKMMVEELINSLIFSGFDPEGNQEHIARLHELLQTVDPVVAQEGRNPNICPHLGPELLTWLLNSASKWPWFNQLALAGMIYAATGTVHQTASVASVHAFLKWAIPDHYPDLDHLDVETALSHYFGPKLASRGADAYKNYGALQRQVKLYLSVLPQARQAALRSAISMRQLPLLCARPHPSPRN